MRIRLEAMPDSTSRFDDWGHLFCAHATDGTCTLPGPFGDVYASFDYTGPSLQVVRKGPGTGWVRSDPPGIWCGMDCTEPYPWGSPVMLVAEADPLSRFVGWVGPCSGEGSTPASTAASRTGSGTDADLHPATAQSTGFGTESDSHDVTVLNASPVRGPAAASSAGRGAATRRGKPWEPRSSVSPASPGASIAGSAPVPSTGPCTVPVEGPQTVEAWFHRPIILRAPAEAALYFADSAPPAFEWHPGTADRFKVLWSASPSFGKKSLSSGKEWISGESFAPDPALWNRILRLSGSTGSVYWTVKGVAASGKPEVAEPGAILLAAATAPAVTSPVDGQSFGAQDPPPTIVWEPNRNESYRITFSPRSDITGKPKVQSGKGFTLAGDSWTISGAAWDRIKNVLAPRGGGTVHYAIEARDALGRTTRSPAYLLAIR
jgi:hypothetical protein